MQATVHGVGKSRAQLSNFTSLHITCSWLLTKYEVTLVGRGGGGVLFSTNVTGKTEYPFAKEKSDEL